MNKDILIGIIIGIIIGIFIMVILYYFNYIFCPSIDNIAQILIRQSARWLVASQQDKSPLIAMLHSMYGFGYFMALKEIATEDTINKYVNVKKFEKELNNALDNSTTTVAKNCPQYASELNLYFAKIAGDI